MRYKYILMSTNLTMGSDIFLNTKIHKKFGSHNASLSQSMPFKHYAYQSKKISNDQELIQSDPISCPQNQKGNN